MESGLLRGWVVAGVVLAVAAWGCESDDRAFDVEAWRAHAHPDAAATTTRQQMLDDLLKNELRAGMERQAVVALLGEPEQRSDKAGIEWVYYLDRTAADFLVLTFEGDRLMHIRVSRD